MYAHDFLHPDEVTTTFTKTWQLTTQAMQRIQFRRLLEGTEVWTDRAVTAILVDPRDRADELMLRCYSRCGNHCYNEPVPLFAPGSQALTWTSIPEFDHDFTGMSVPTRSALHAALDTEITPAWVADLTVLRMYSVEAEIRRTERQLLLVQLEAAMQSGQARPMILPSDLANPTDHTSLDDLDEIA